MNIKWIQAQTESSDVLVNAEQISVLRVNEKTFGHSISDAPMYFLSAYIGGTGNDNRVELMVSEDKVLVKKCYNILVMNIAEGYNGSNNFIKIDEVISKAKNNMPY